MRTNRLIAIVVATLCSALVVVPAVPSPALAAPNLQASKAAPGTALAGEPLTYSITASNPGAGSDPLYNVTFRDVLPLGVTYAGPTTPAEAGEPQIITNQVPDTNPGAAPGATIPQQTLIWSNVADIQADDSLDLSFGVDVNSTGDRARNDVHVIGATITNSAEVYGSSDPRRLPTFAADGTPVAGATISVAPTGPASTTFTALEITKSEPSSEGELLRGVHDKTTTYTLEVDVTDLAPVDGVIVTDYLPAALEFLGCGNVDNSALGTEEYLNSGRLTTGDGGANCLLPTSVETVENPPPDGTTVYPPGVYTKVTWTLPTLDASVTGNTPFLITYAAGVPLLSNELFPGIPPTPGSLQQGSNLDNNTGPSTREQPGTESAVTNVARVSGTFTDSDLIEPGVPTADVADDDRLSRSIEDLRIRKEIVAPANGRFTAGAEAEYRIVIETSEYMNASSVVLTDQVPNGLCPLGNVPYAASEVNCQLDRGPNPDFASVTPTDGGGYEVVFAPIAVPAGSQLEASYKAFMRGAYEGGALDGRPTVSGDDFTNVVGAITTTTGIPEIQAPAFDAEIGAALPGIEDGSQATLVTGSLSLAKDILPRDVRPRLDALAAPVDRCPDRNTGETLIPPVTTDQYIDGDATPVPGDVEQLGFRLGDQVCFRLRVDFDEFTQTRNVEITDFIPPGTSYVANSVRATGESTAPFTLVSSEPAGPLVFDVGEVRDGGLFVVQGGVFEVVFAVEIDEVPASDNAVLSGNLMKMRSENSVGQAQSYRDGANFAIVPPPPVGVVKGVASVNAPANGPNAENSNVDGVEVRQGSQVTFRVDLTNLGVPEEFTDYSVRELEVLDLLPEQVGCADISSITNFGPNTGLGECLDPGDVSADGLYTNDLTAPARSVLRWPLPNGDASALYPANFTTGDVLDPSWLGTRSLTYTLEIPTPTSVSTRFDNVAGVRTYGGFTNLQGVTSPAFIPADNVDAVLRPQSNAPAADDDSWLITPGPAVSKFVTSAITETNNNTSNPLPTASQPINGESAQAVVGEFVTFRYFVDVPAQTTILRGELSDVLPVSLTIDNTNRPAGVPAAALQFYPDAEVASTGTVPAGVVFDPATGAVDFGPAYVNATTADQRFEVVLPVRVTGTGLAVAAQPTRENGAQFDSVDAAFAPLPPVTDSADVQIRQPQPTLGKAVVAGLLPSGLAIGGLTLTYRLTAQTPGGRPPLHDTWVEDCVPAEFASVALVTPGANDRVLTGAAAETEGCAVGETYLAVGFGTLAPGVVQTRDYTAVVRNTVVAGTTITNGAELAGSSLDDGDTGPGLANPLERVYRSDAEADVRIAGAGLLKSVNPEEARIGERVEFTVDAVIPPDTNFFQAALVDLVPTGLSDIQLLSQSCFVGLVTPVPCGLTATQLGPIDVAGGELLALYFGDILADPQTRVLQAVYSAIVEDIATNVDGTRLENSARTNWDVVDLPDGVVTGPDYDWSNQGTVARAVVDVLEPDVVVTKSVSNVQPGPGDQFEYTLNVANRGRSEAWDVVITDVLPPGVELIVDPPNSPADGGVYDPATRTITWTAPATFSLAAGADTNLRYLAQLAPSNTIGQSSPPAVFTNTATVEQFASLPDTFPDRRVEPGNSDTEVVEPQFPELDVVKTVVDAPPAYLNEPVTWRITVTNNGGATAFSVDAGDILPPNWSYVPNSAVVTTPSTSGPVEPVGIVAGLQTRLLWDNIGLLEPNETLSIEFDATPTDNVTSIPGVGGTIAQVNEGAARAVDATNEPGNLDGAYADDATASTRIDRVDVAISKASSGSAVAGSNFSWSIVVRNLGPDPAVGPFVVTDAIPTLPAGVTFASASGSGWTCTPATGPASPPTIGDVTCRRTGTLASGAAFPGITFTVRIPSDTPSGTLISNTASVGGQRTYERPTDLANNTATDTDPIITRADLRIVKTLVTPPGLVAGTDSTYNLAITNLGPSTSRATVAQPIVVRDTLPSTVSFVSATDIAGTPAFTCTHDGSATGGVVTCNRTTDMLLSASSTIRVVVRVPSGLTGNLTNTSTVTPAITTDPVTGNNTSSVTNPIVERADLGITKTALGPNVPGEPTTYRLSVTNNGPGDATVRIQDTLPAGLTYRSFSNVAGTWTCAASTAPDPVPGFRCDLTGKLAFTASPLNVATVDVVVDTAPSVIGTVRNTAVVSTTAQDTNPTNNTAFADLTFVGVADLALTKTSSGSAVPGGPIEWTINVENLGVSDSQPTISVTDQLPDGIIGPVTAGGVGWSCNTDPNLLVTCVRSTVLAARAETEFTIRAIVDPATPGPDPITNTATVVPTTIESNDPNDPKTANNTDSDVVNLAEPDVELAKSVDDATPQPGAEFTYTIELTNNGPVPAYNLDVSDVVPAGIEFVRSDDGGTYTDATRTVVWTLAGPIAPNASASVSFVAILADSDTIDETPITNTASLDSFESLPSGGRVYVGNTDDAIVTPRFPELTAAKSALGPTPTYIGDEFAWEITITNSGQGDASAVRVVDLLPRNWTFVAGSTTVTAPSGATSPVPTVTDTNASDDIIDQEIEWTDVGPLAAGESLIVTFRAVPTAAVADDPGVGRDQEHTNRVGAVATDDAGFEENATGLYASNQATADAFIDAADLVIEKLNSPDPAIAGTDYSWTLRVRNDGPDTAVGPFTVVDTLPVLTPDPLTFVGASGDGWLCTEAAGQVTCTRDGTLPAPTVGGDPLAAFPDITITVRIPSDFLGDMTNTATVEGRTFDPDVANNSDTIVTPVGGEADLEIAKRRTDPTITAGETVTYLLDVTNNGPSTSRATISVVDTLPAGATFFDGPTFAAGDPWDCTPDVPAAGQVTCELDGDLLAGQPAPQIAITVSIASGAPVGVDLVNTATVVPGATPEGAADPNDPNDPKIANNTDTDIGAPIASADLSIDKRSTGELIAGDPAVYRLQVDNFGPSDANAPVISDTLPAGLTFTGFTSNPVDVTGQAPGVWSCTAPPDNGSFTCTLDRALVADGFTVVDIRVRVAEDVIGEIVNTATVSSTTPDPIPENNTDDDRSPFDAFADLAIVKTGPDAPVVAGDTFDWTLTVTNNGPSLSRQPITVFDALPDTVEFLSVADDPWSCVDAPATVAGYSTVLTCTLTTDLTASTVGDANIAPPIGISVRSLPDAGPAIIVNQSAVRGTTNDPNQRNNSSDHEVELIDDADVQIVKTPETQTVRAGEPATFTLQVTNNGLSSADNVVVTDPLPSGMTMALPLVAAGWDCSASTTVSVECERPSLAPGTAAPITIVALVGSGVPDGAELTNVATVASSTPDSVPSNNVDDAVVDVAADGDLAVTKTHPALPDPVLAGTRVEFEIVVTNNGPSDAVADVVVVDTLPAGFAFLSARGGWECTPRVADPQVIDCTKLGGGLVAGAQADRLFILTQVDPTLDSGVYTNVATVDSPTADSVPGNDRAEDDVNVGTVADVSIIKSHDPDAVRIGEELEFTLEVRNDGPSEARDVVVTDTLPAGFTFVSVAGVDDPSTWDCAGSAGQDVECALLAPLPPFTDAEDIVVTVRVEPEAFPSLANTADVVTSTTDPDLDNNTSTDPVAVPRLVDLFITKTHAEPVAVGQPIVYTLTVGNNGPIDDDAVITVTDSIPAGLEVTDATSADADCSIADDVVTCTKDDGLGVDETFEITITADVLPGAYPSVTNTAEVSSPTDDVDPANNRASDTAVVPPLVDLAITKTHAGPVQVGSQITYTVTVRNNGPTPDPGPVRMLDTLPGSLTPVSATSDGMTCEITGQTVACQALAPLGVDAELVITIVANVGPGASPSVSNTAIVTTPGCSVGPAAGLDTACPDTDLTNNQATDVATVAPLIVLAVDKTLASLEGVTATWAIVVTNQGPNATVEPIQMLDNLPSTLSYVSATGQGWVCGNVGQTVGCTYAASLQPGASAPIITIVTTIDAPAGTQIVNTASVGGGGPGVGSVTDSSDLVAPARPPLPSTGGGPGILLQWAPTMLALGLALVIIARRRRDQQLLI